MELSQLSIRILFKCHEKLLQKKYISQYYSRYTASERQNAIETLLSNSLIEAEQILRPGIRKAATVYKITDIGKKWVSEYEKKIESLDL